MGLVGEIDYVTTYQLGQSFIELFVSLACTFFMERAFFRGICGKIFALFQACVGNSDTIPPWKVDGSLYLDSSCVTFKYFAFLSV